MLADPTPRTRFLTEGVDEPHGQRRRLAALTEDFGPLLTWGDTRWQVGQGPERGGCLHAAQRVVEFLDVLRASSRIRPNLETLPRPRPPGPCSMVG